MGQMILDPVHGQVTAFREHAPAGGRRGRTMRQLTQLEMVIATGRSANERYRLLARAGCLAPRARVHRSQVLGILDIWPAGQRGNPIIGQEPVEGNIARALEQGGFLSPCGRALDGRFPGEWDAVLWLRTPVWRRLFRPRPAALRC